MFRSSLAAAFIVAAALPAASGQEKNDGKLTPETLLQTLEDMGYSPKKTTRDKLFQVRLSRGDYDATIRIFLTYQNDMIGLGASGRRIARPMEMPASFWKELLVQNERLSSGGTFWGYYRGSCTVEFYHYFRNSHVTPALLRKEINTYFDEVGKNDKIFNAPEPDVAPIVDSSAEAKERATLQGRWEGADITSDGAKYPDENFKKDTDGRMKITMVFDKQGGSCQWNTVEPMWVRMGPEPGQMAIYVTSTKRLWPCRYKVEKNTLTICYDKDGFEYPTVLESTKENGFTVIKLQRVEP